MTPQLILHYIQWIVDVIVAVEVLGGVLMLTAAGARWWRRANSNLPRRRTGEWRPVEKWTMIAGAIIFALPWVAALILAVVSRFSP